MCEQRLDIVNMRLYHEFMSFPILLDIPKELPRVQLRDMGDEAMALLRKTLTGTRYALLSSLKNVYLLLIHSFIEILPFLIASLSHNEVV